MKMTSCLAAFLVFFMPALFASRAFVPDEMEFQQATTIVDATVTALTPEGFARIEVHEYLKGKDAPTIIKKAWYNPACSTVTPAKVGVVSNKRYVFVLLQDEIAGLQPLYFEVTTSKDGKAFVLYPLQAKEPISMADFKVLLKKGPEAPGPSARKP